MVYLDYIPCLRYTILVWNPRYNNNNNVAVSVDVHFLLSEYFNNNLKRSLYAYSNRKTPAGI